MTVALRPPAPAACAACIAAPIAVPDEAAPVRESILLSLPDIHCYACINDVERTLNALDGIRSARVNLTLRRVAVDADDLSVDDLIAALAQAGHTAHELDPAHINATATNRRGRDLLMRLAVAGFATMNIMLLSVAVWSGAEGPTRDLFHWISAAIALPATCFAAQPFFLAAYQALKAGKLNMDVPIALAITLALGTSLWETTLGGEQAYFDAAITLTFFLLAGRYLDHRTRAMARSAAEELTALEVPKAVRITHNEAGPVETVVPLEEVVAGDLIALKPGARAPVDGVIMEGASELDRSMLTGETLPVHVRSGMAISAGEINLSAPLLLQTTAAGKDSSLNRLAELVAIAESGRARYTSLADKAAKLYVPGVHILSALAFLGWLLYAGDLRIALNIAAAVLIITCPCALGLAVPAVTTAASGRLFRRGFLIKHETALERLAEVDTIVFDKTGTLTGSEPTLSNLEELPERSLSIAMGMAAGSSHPLSRAILRAGQQRGVTPTPVTNLREIAGQGAIGQLAGQQIKMGRASWLNVEDNGALTSTWLAVDDAPPIAFTFGFALRSGAATAINQVIQRGYQVHMLSGDRPAPVEQVARSLGISTWVAQATPEAKAEYVAALRNAGAQVLMMGDGLNDTAVLAAADVSISPASALDAARAASDVVLMGQDLSQLPTALETAQYATRRIKENFRIATIYNVLAVPLAIMGFCSPLIAALAMSLSSITVSLNALRLR